MHIGPWVQGDPGRYPAHGHPRVCTANVMNVQEWCGYRLKWSYPLQRKAIVFQITDYLIDEEWRN